VSFSFALFALALAALLFPFSAIAGGNKERGLGNAGRAGLSAQPAPVTISVLLSDDVEGKGIHEGAEDFFRRTGVRVRFTSVNWEDMGHIQAMSFASGTPEFDAVVSDARLIAEHAKSGRYADLSAIAADEKASLGVIPPGVAGGYVEGILDLATVNARVFGLPLTASWSVAFVNIRLLREAGLDPGRPPAAWPDILKIGRVLKSRSVYVLTDSLKPGESTTSTFLRWASSAGARVWERRGDRVYWTLDSRECQEAALFLRKLLYEGLMDPGIATRSEEDCLEFFMRNGVAILPGRDFWYKPLRGGFSQEDVGDVPLDAAAVPFPGARPGLCGAIARHRFLSITTAGRDISNARSFVRFITSREESRRRALEDGLAPVFSDLYEDPDMRESVPVNAVLASSKQSAAEPAIPQFEQISEVISDTLQDILVNNRDPAAALSEAAQRANRLCGW
jgi:ABC-type glycerol-3-phosphate transport system substrate-binding protein